MNNLKTVAFLSTGDVAEATHRITILGLKKFLTENNIEIVDITSKRKIDAIFATRHIDPYNPNILPALTSHKSSGTKIFVFVNDLYPSGHSILEKWSRLASIFLAPTEIHKIFLESLFELTTEILPDCIDYLISNKTQRIHKKKDKLDICWFGYPESYNKSMSLYHPQLLSLVKENRITYTIISKNLNVPDPVKFLEFNPDTFPATLSGFDLCVLSHAPLDYSLNSLAKSNNKLTLAVALGVPCVTSQTPSYKSILNHCGLSEYCFSSPESFAFSVKGMFSESNRNLYLAKSQNFVLSNYSYQSIGRNFVDIYHKL